MYNYLRIIPILSALVVVLKTTNAQPIAAPEMISSKKTFRISAKDDKLKEMVALSAIIPWLKVDMKYATAQNFMQEPLYPSYASAWMRMAAAEKLKAVQIMLGEKGLGLKIWDAYRPWSVTKKMWEKIGDERYVANPSRGSGHNRGVSVDLTLIELSTGAELNMGTGFDNFSDTASANFSSLSTQVLENRKKLISAMQKQGFKVLDTEWWHFSLPDAKQYEVLNLSFKQLAAINKKKK